MTTPVGKRKLPAGSSATKNIAVPQATAGARDRTARAAARHAATTAAPASASGWTAARIGI